MNFKNKYPVPATILLVATMMTNVGNASHFEQIGLASDTVPATAVGSAYGHTASKEIHSSLAKQANEKNYHIKSAALNQLLKDAQNKSIASADAHAVEKFTHSARNPMVRANPKINRLIRFLFGG